MASRHNTRRTDTRGRGRPPAAPSRRWSTVTGQPAGKANYRPMTNMSRRPSRQQLTRQGSVRDAEMNAVLEGMPEESTPQPRLPSRPLPSPKKRYSYHQPSDPKVAAEMPLLTKYVKEKNLLNAMMACCQSVLQRDSLPYNPYPEFASRIRRDAERFHMFAKTGKAIQTELTNKLQATTTPPIYGVKGHSNVWGLEAIVNATSPQALKRYEWLVEDVSPTKIFLSEEQQEYSGQVLVAMVGPAAFTGTMYREAPSVDLRIEYVIYGPDVDTGLLIFNNCISEDIRLHISPDCPHRILGIIVPGSQSSGEVFWTIGQARGQWDNFWDSVRDAVMRKQPITVQYVFLLDKETNVYWPGNKQFVLHFVETSEDSSKEKFMSFAELPYLTLYEGVFLKKAHPEAYVMTMKRHQELAQSGAGVSQPNGRRQSMEDSLVSLQEGARDDGSGIVYADAVREPIREKWQRQIAKLHPVREAFRLAHFALLLAFSDRSVESSEVKIELYRFLHSTAASWHTATLLSSVLQMLAVTVNRESDSDLRFLTQQFLEYRRRLLAVLDPDLHARSSELHAAHAVLTEVTQQMLVPDPADPSKYVLKSGDLSRLQFIQDYCTTLQLLLTEDAMSFFSRLNLEALVSGCKQAFSKEVQKPAEAGKKKQQPAKSTKSKVNVLPEAASPVKINHGMESKEITQQKNIVIDVEEVKSFSNWPRIMVTEAVLMQYMVDVKLDLVWLKYLQELLTGDHLPPNPYPRLVTLLRQAAHRMQLCSETNLSLVPKLLRQDQTRLVDRASGVYGVTNVGAFGLSSRTLAGVDADPGAFVKVAKLMDQLANRDVVARRGQFQISVSQAVGGGCAYYGRLVPYINVLHLYEHYYIRGNIGTDSDAIQLYAKLVYDYITNLSAKNLCVVVGVYLDDSNRYVSETDLETDKATFFSHVVDAARKKEDMYLKIYQPVGWRYLCIHKHFVLHYLFVDNTEDRHECYSPDDPSTLHQYVFLSQEEATAHCRGSGVKELGDIESAANMKSVNNYLTKQVEGALREHRVMQAYEAILIKALVNKDTKGLSNAWRVFHSAAYQLEYVQTINTDLQTLVRYTLMFPTKLARAAPSNQSLNNKGRGNKAKVEVDLSSQSPFNDTTLAKFVSVYSDKLSSVLQEPCAFVPSSLVELIQERLKTIVGVNSQTQRQGLVIEHETVTTLKEVFQLVQPVLDWVSYDIHRSITHHESGYIAPQDKV